MSRCMIRGVRIGGVSAELNSIPACNEELSVVVVWYRAIAMIVFTVKRQNAGSTKKKKKEINFHRERKQNQTFPTLSITFSIATYTKLVYITKFTSFSHLTFSNVPEGFHTFEKLNQFNSNIALFENTFGHVRKIGGKFEETEGREPR